MATLPEPHLITAAQFLQIDFGSDIKAELDNGMIRMMAGGTARHAQIQSNIQGLLWQGLRGSRCRAFGPDMGLRTHDLSVRYPDISVYCGKDAEVFDSMKAFDDPVVLIEILSPSTAALDQGAKLQEYQALPSVQTILLVDPKLESVRTINRTGPQNWTDDRLTAADNVQIPHLKLVLSGQDIFAR